MLIAEGMVTAGVDRSHNVVIGDFSKTNVASFFFRSGITSSPFPLRSRITPGETTKEKSSCKRGYPHRECTTCI